MKPYELAFIIQPNIDDEGVGAVVEQVTDYIVNRYHGEMVATNLWGRRRLAYPINDYKEGTYVLFQANIPPSAIAEIERQLNISEDIIRFLVFRVEEN